MLVARTTPMIVRFARSFVGSVGRGGLHYRQLAMAVQVDYQKTRDELQKSFNSGVTLPYEYRMGQLKQCVAMLNAMEQDYADAIKKDIGKHPAEVNGSDLKTAESEIEYAMEHLHSWMTDAPVKMDNPHLSKMDQAYQHSEPKGVVMVIGAWNYPLSLTLVPVIGAICAGNCVVIKLSEVSSNSSEVMKKYFDLYLDPLCFRTFEGGIPTSTALLKIRWDHIFFTGSVNVGRIVARAAAEHLTPVTLELGGKSPVIVDETTDIDVATKRIAWGKSVNAGQTCVAPDYVYCHKSQYSAFIERYRAHIKEMYGDDPEQSDDFARIINDRNFNRLRKLLDQGTVEVGGKINPATRYIAPTLISSPITGSELMTDEIFGPILPIIQFDDLETVINEIRSKEKPLVAYIFSENAEHIEMVKKRVSSGTLDVNDTISHMMVHTLPFGGVGNSGMGAYHGRATFDTFSHIKSVLHRPIGRELESALSIRYAPYGADWRQTRPMFTLNKPNM